VAKARSDAPARAKHVTLISNPHLQIAGESVRTLLHITWPGDLSQQIEGRRPAADYTTKSTGSIAAYPLVHALDQLFWSGENPTLSSGRDLEAILLSNTLSFMRNLPVRVENIAFKRKLNLSIA
jgi:hypothetical protein